MSEYPQATIPQKLFTAGKAFRRSVLLSMTAPTITIIPRFNGCFSIFRETEGSRLAETEQVEQSSACTCRFPPEHSKLGFTVLKTRQPHKKKPSVSMSTRKVFKNHLHPVQPCAPHWHISNTQQPHPSGNLRLNLAHTKTVTSAFRDAARKCACSSSTRGKQFYNM